MATYTKKDIDAAIKATEIAIHKLNKILDSPSLTKDAVDSLSLITQVLSGKVSKIAEKAMRDRGNWKGADFSYYGQLSSYRTTLQDLQAMLTAISKSKSRKKKAGK